MFNRGNLAFNLLPIVALVLCASALFSFINFDDRLHQPSQEFAKLTSDLNVMQQYIESSSKLIARDAVLIGVNKENIQKLAQKRDLHLQGQGNFFTQIEEGNFKISKSSQSTLLEVDGVFIQSRAGESFGQRNLNITVEVDSQGEFIKFINK